MAAKFQLVSDYPPAGDQPKAIQQLADGFAAEGYLALAPALYDRSSVKDVEMGYTTEDIARGRALREEFSWEDSVKDVEAAVGALRGEGLRVGAVGYCWGGSISFLAAVRLPLDAAVVYYGSAPEAGYQAIRAPVLGLYAGDDARVNATVPAAQAEMGRLGKRFEVESYEGAGHGFLRQQDGRDGANARAAAAAWPRTVAFFREALGA